MRLQYGIAAMAALSVCNPVVSYAKGYNARKQFSSSNPDASWSYGYGTTGSSFTPYANYTPNMNGVAGLQFWNISGDEISDIPYLGINATGATYVLDGALVYPTNIVIDHPGPTVDSILQWTAPAAGTYNFTGLYEILDPTPTGIAALIFDGSTNITSTAFNGGTGVLRGPGSNPAKGKPGGKEKFSFQLTVVQGEVISFGLNNDGDYDNDSTGLLVTIKSAAP